MSYDAPLGVWVTAEKPLLGLGLGGRKPKILCAKVQIKTAMKSLEILRQDGK